MFQDCDTEKDTDNLMFVKNRKRDAFLLIYMHIVLKDVKPVCTTGLGVRTERNVEQNSDPTFSAYCRDVLGW